MRDIEKLITDIRADLELFEATTQENVESLITTIESQKEEIEAYQRSMTSEAIKNASLQQQISSFQAWQPNSWDSHLQIESLKAITELAVKGLKQVCYFSPTGTDSFDAADSTLSEIERLQNE